MSTRTVHTNIPFVFWVRRIIFDLNVEFIAIAKLGNSGATVISYYERYAAIRLS